MSISLAVIILSLAPLQGEWSYVFGYNVNSDGIVSIYCKRDHSVKIVGPWAYFVIDGIVYKGRIYIAELRHRTLAIDIEFESGQNTMKLRCVFISNGRMAVLRFADSDVAARPSSDLLSQQRSITNYIYTKQTGKHR